MPLGDEPVYIQNTPWQDGLCTSAGASAGGGACHTEALRVVFDRKWVPLVQKNPAQAHLATTMTPIVLRAATHFPDKNCRNTCTFGVVVPIFFMFKSTGAQHAILG